MKPIKILFIVLILFTGCRTTRKTSQSSIKTETAVTTNQTVDTDKTKKVDNDLQVVKKTTTKTTKYRPKKTVPAKPNAPEITNIKPEEPEIESETTTVVEETLVDKGKIVENEAKKEELNTTTEVKSEVVTKTKEVKKAAIKPYMIVLGILGVITALIFFFRKSSLIGGILTFIKKLFGGK